jgi:hypothetical protein
MTMTTTIVLLVALGIALIGSMLLLLGHAVHADRFMHRVHLSQVSQPERERIAA